MNFTFTNNKKLPFYFAFYFIILSAFLCGFYFLFLSSPKYYSQKIINIKQGSSLRMISKNLKENNIIRSRIAFETFVIIYGGEKHIFTGSYNFEKSLPVFEIAKRLTLGNRNLIPIKITIPEGFNNSDIGELFVSKLSNFNKENFLNLAKDKQGYLFPDTYFFYQPSNENDVINALTDNFNKKIKNLISEINSFNKTQEEIITMASIIEREAKGDDDRDIISSVLWNRLNKNMLLQVDAWPATYKIKGLPENPISNPGIEALRSAINPANSDYLFYLHDKNGIAHFAKTFAEHKRNISKYLK